MTFSTFVVASLVAAGAAYLLSRYVTHDDVPWIVAAVLVVVFGLVWLL